MHKFSQGCLLSYLCTLVTLIFISDRFVCLFVCLFKVGISTDKTVYLKWSYAKGKKKEKKEKKKSKRKERKEEK